MPRNNRPVEVTPMAGAGGGKNAMNIGDFAADTLGRMATRLISDLEGLTVDELCYRPDPEANTIAWLAWHVTRVQDHHMAHMEGRVQLWVDEGWDVKLGMPSDLDDHGYGHTSEQVGAFVPPDGATLAAYQRAVSERTIKYLSGLPDDELGRVIDRSWDPPVTVGVRLASVVNETAQHIGQVSYVRGLVERTR